MLLPVVLSKTIFHVFIVTISTMLCKQICVVSVLVVLFAVMQLKCKQA